MLTTPLTPSHFWAKLDRDKEGKIEGWYPLVAHSADVASVFRVLLQETSLRNRLSALSDEGLTEVHVKRLAVLAALHDAGKANQGFQNRAFGEQARDDHLTPIVGMLSTVEKRRIIGDALGLRDLTSWFDDMGEWLRTTWSHHGWPVDIHSPGPGRWPDRSLSRLERLGDEVRDWFPRAFEGSAPVLTSPQLQHLFNGALTLADWIASEDSFWKKGRKEDLLDPSVAIQDAESKAREAVGNLYLDLRGSEVDDSLEAILGGYNPYDIQEKIQQLPVPEDGTLTILESATGSGKTEGAIGRFLRLLRQGEVDSMYFALPTRSAATQLHGRVRKVAQSTFETPPPVHLAVPGYLKVDDTEGQRFGFDVRWDEPVGPRGWAAESSKRYTASPIAVGTVDQVLLSALRTNHSHLRTAGLSRSLLVVDEVHASSVYMNELLHDVLSFHRASGGHAVLMSATLGSRARASFTGSEVPAFEEAREQDYPLITHAAADEEPERVSTTAPSDGKEVQVKTSPSMERPKKVAAQAQKAAEEGAHVLVIRNTVPECQKTHGHLDNQLSLQVSGVACPHHSRYAPEDRERLDERVEQVYGKNEVEGEPTRPEEGGVVTVATQTVEQSLDIDADLLITDLCPMDVLLQRIGRLHRHNRPKRPSGYEKARCILLTPSNRDLTAGISPGDGRGFPGPGLGSVYRDLRIIEATWRTVESREHVADGWIEIPEDNRALVEESTHPAVIEEIESRGVWQSHADQVRKLARAEALEARNNLIDRAKPFTADSNQFPGHQLKTRLGEEDIQVELQSPQRTPFGEVVQQITLSPYLFDDRPDHGKAEQVSQSSTGFRFTFAGREFEYTSSGICKS